MGGFDVRSGRGNSCSWEGGLGEFIVAGCNCAAATSDLVNNNNVAHS
jgi:hypothetical protein